MKTNFLLIILGLVIAVVCVFLLTFFQFDTEIIGSILLGYFYSIIINLLKPISHKKSKNVYEYWLRVMMFLLVTVIILNALFDFLGYVFNKSFILPKETNFLFIFFYLSIGYVVGLGYMYILKKIKSK